MVNKTEAELSSTWQAPTDADLRAKRLNFLRECKPKMLRRLRLVGALEESLTLHAEAARRYAANMIQQGIWEQEAWNLAIRQEILDSESE